MSLRVFTLCVVFSFAAFGSNVLFVHNKKPYVMVSQDEAHPIDKLDQVCTTKDGFDMACGEVIFSNEKMAIFEITYQRELVREKRSKTKTTEEIELNFDYPLPKPGDKVRLVSKEPRNEIRRLASDLVSSNTFGGEVISERKQEEFQQTTEKLETIHPYEPLSILTGGMNFTSPTVQYQQAITNTWSLGLMPTYMNYSVNGGSFKGFGGFLTYNHYSGGPFKGFWWQLSAGLYQLTAYNGSNSASFYAPAGLATVGWRFSWKDRLNVGLGIGSQYVSKTANGGGTGFTYSGFVPALTVDAGLIF